MRVPASERSAFVNSSNGRFSVSRKPDCAKVRELFDAFRGAEAMSRRCREVDRDAFGHANGASADARHVPDSRRERIRNRGAEDARCMRALDGRAKKKPLADNASGFGWAGRAPDGTGARGVRAQWPSSSSSSA
ncbi:MAG: hypothetical protein HOP03_03725 [Lysobacter sp.]|nr:hypothetical protein [Lysobacter sp.]